MNALPITAMTLETMLGPVAWALVHFLWQGALMALAAGLALAALRGRSARARYLAACAGLAAMALLPAATAFYLGTDPGVPPIASEPAGTVGAAPAEVRATPSELPQPLRLTDRFEPLLPWLVALWLTGVTALSLTHFGGWRRVRRLRRATRPAAARWEAAVERLARRLEISRPVRLLESTRLRVPVVVGWLRPAILVPASAFAGLAPHQLEAVLAHELAHVRRHDYLVNLFQIAVETLLFYHPAVWWLSRQVRNERENCCDDLAVEVCGNAATYARALADLEELRFGTPAFALGADGGSLLGRVRRLLGRGDEPPANGWLAAGVAVLAAAAGAAFLVFAAASAAAPTPETPAAEAASPETPSWAAGWMAEETGAAFEVAQAAEEEPPREVERRRERRWHRHGDDDDDDGIEDDVEELRRSAAGTPYESRLGDEGFRKMARHGCDEDLIPGLARAGADAVATDDLLRLCRHGVDGDDVEDFRKAGFRRLSVDELTLLARNGVDGDDLEGFAKAGLEGLTVEDLVTLSRHGVDGNDVEELVEAGYRGLSVEDMVTLARHGVDGDDAKEIAVAGYPGLSVDQLVDLARHGVDGDDLEELRKAGHDLSIDEVLRLARTGEIHEMTDRDDD